MEMANHSSILAMGKFHGQRRLTDSIINASSYDPVFSGIVAQLVKNLLAMRETWD